MTRLSTTLQEIRRSGELLRLLIDELRELLEEPPDNENSRWIVTVLDKMLENLRRLFELEEQRGYLSDVLEQYPNWHPHVEHLRQQHDLLRRQLREVRNRFATDDGGGHRPKGGRAVREARRHLHGWLQAYDEHQRRERDLIQEAFTLEPGVGE